MGYLIANQKTKKKNKIKGGSGFIRPCYQHEEERGDSDDCSIKVKDPREKGKAIKLVNPYYVLTLLFNDNVESCRIDNDIKIGIIEI